MTLQIGPNFSIPKDALQAAGVVENDRDIFESHYIKALDAKNPRVELVVGQMETP